MSAAGVAGYRRGRILRRIGPWLAALLTAAPAFGAEPPEPLWTVAVDGPYRLDRASSSCYEQPGAESIGTDADGNLYAAGVAIAAVSRTRERNFVASWSTAGELRWVRWVDEFNYFPGEPRIGMRDSGSPRLAVAYPAAGSSYEVRSYDENGTELWRASPGASDLDPVGVGFDSSGAFVVASRTATGGLHLARYVAEGGPDWTSTDDELVYAEGAHVVGSAVVAWSDAPQVALYSVGGSRIWLSALSPEPGFDDSIRDVRLDGSGRAFGTGRRCGAAACAPLVFSLDESGGFRWSDSWTGGAGNDIDIGGASIALGLTGEVYVGGVGQGSGLDAILLRYSEDGLLDWSRSIDRGIGGDDGIASVLVRADGSIRGAGHSEMTSSRDGLLVFASTPAGGVTASYPLLLSSQDETACQVLQTVSGSLGLVGDRSNVDFRIAELDASDNVLWAAQQPSIASPDDVLGGVQPQGSVPGIIAFGARGDIWLAAATGEANASDMDPMVVHLDPDGGVLGLGVPFSTAASNHPEAVNSIVPTADGGAVASGNLWESSWKDFVVALDAMLQPTATWVDDPGWRSLSKGLFRLEDGSFRLASLRGDGTLWNFDLLALDEQIAPLWHATSSHPLSSPSSAIRSDNGDFWLTGDSAEGDPLRSSCYTVGFAPGGGVLWEATFGEPDADLGCSALSASPDRVVVGGSGYPDAGGTYIGVVVSYDATGAVEWSKYGEITPGDEWRLVQQVLLEPNGDVLVAGSLDAPWTNVPIVARLAPDGSFLWSRSFEENGNDIVSRLIRDADGYFYAMMRSAERTVVKLSADGWPLWTFAFAPRWGGYGMALDPQQNLIVVGSEYDLGAGGGLDIHVTKLPGGLDLFSDSFETGDTSRWSSAFP